jgi:hypothetical protein
VQLKRSRSLLFTVYLALIAVLIAISLIIVLPVNYEYYALSSEERGHRDLLNKGITWIASISSIRGLNANKTLLIIARSTPIVTSELSVLLEFTSSGGIVIAYGSREFTESILKGLGYEVTYRGPVIDPIYSVNNPSRVLVYSLQWNTTVVLDTPYVFNVTGISSRGELLHTDYTSMFSFIDEVEENGVYDANEPIGEFPVIYTIKFNSGLIVIICAHGVFTNSVLGENTNLLNRLAIGDRIVILDQSEFKNSLLAYFKLLIVTPKGVSPLFILIVSLIVAVVLYYAYSHETFK